MDTYSFYLPTVKLHFTSYSSECQRSFNDKSFNSLNGKLLDSAAQFV